MEKPTFEKWFLVGSVQFRLRVIAGSAYIWIPGTDNVFKKKSRMDALKDILVSAQCWPNLQGRHAGCDRVAKKILEIPEVVAELDKISGFIHAAGYSLGGGVAECFAERKDSDMAILKTYGQYRVIFRSDKKKSYFTERIIKGQDKIRWLFFWFRGPVTARQTSNPDGKWPMRWFKDHTSYQIPEKE